MSRYHGLTGEQALAQLTQHLTETSRTLRANQGRLDIPTEWRRKVRRDAVADAQLSLAEAQRAFVDWRDRKVSDARQALAAESVGTQAEELAKLRREQTVQRLIDTARRQDEANGAQVVNGRVLRNVAALNLAAEAQRLYLETSDYHGAIAHATAAEALGVADAAKWRRLAQEQLDQADPAKRAAYRDLALVERAEAIFVRDTSAALVDVFQAAATEAADMGDYPGPYSKLATGHSLTAKAAAMAISSIEGKPYEAPAGALPGGPARDLGAES